MKSGLVWLFIIVVVIGLGLYFVYVPTVPPGGLAPKGVPVTFYCGNGNTIVANFATGSVQLALSSGATYVLPQTVSGSGIRYVASTTAGALVFTNEGASASLTSTASTTDLRFETCTAAHVVSARANGFESYADQPRTFTFTFPNAFMVSGVPAGYGLSWAENATSTGMELARIDVPQSYEPETNFGGAWFTVGASSVPAALASCLQGASGVPGATTTQVTIDGTTFTKMHSIGAGAGNRYDTTSYRVIHDHACYAVEYTIHYSVLENYPPGAVQPFDEQKVRAALENVAHSFKFTS